MRLTPLLTVTALLEAATGVVLLVWPALILALLFGWRQPAPETLVMGRVAGAGALSIGVGSWAALRDTRAPAQRGVLAGILIYNVVSGGVLAFAGAVLGMAGIVLWPAVVYHVALAVWSIACSGHARGIEPQQGRSRP